MSPVKSIKLIEPTLAPRDEVELPVKLSKREAEVLRLYAEGLTIAEIGVRAGRSSKTISAQKMAAMRKLGLKHDSDIFKYAQANGLVQASQTSLRNAQRDAGDV